MTTNPTESAKSDYYVLIRPGKVIKSQSTFKSELKQMVNELYTAYFLNASELQSRIFGKSFGVFSLTIDPIFQSLTYYFLTAIIFKGAVETSFLSLYVTVVFWQLFSKPLLNACSAISANAGILKQTNFPLRTVFFSFYTLEFTLWLISFAVLMVFLFANGIAPNLRWIYLPLIVVTQMALTVCLSFPAAIIGAYIKDLNSLLAPIVAVWFYLSPGIYNRSRVPEQFRWIYDLNPFSSLFEAYRWVFFENGTLFPSTLAGIFFISIALIYLQSLSFRVLMRRLYTYI